MQSINQSINQSIKANTKTAVNKLFQKLSPLVTNKNSRHKGFTLAEVLITLGIIGVVAAMTIPTLMNSTNDSQLKAAWKKSYSVMSNAYLRVLDDNGGSFKGVCSDMNCVRDQFKKYLSYTKECDTAVTNGTNKCFYDATTILKQYGNGQLYGANGGFTASGIILNDGSILVFGDGYPTYATSNSNCTTDYANSNINNSCGWFIIDINGNKAPNTIGKDVFHGWITENAIVAVGAKDQNNATASFYNSSSCDKTNSAAVGWGCSAKMLSE